MRAPAALSARLAARSSPGVGAWPERPRVPGTALGWTGRAKGNMHMGYRMFQITDDTVSVFSDLQSLTEDPEDETVPSDFTQK